MSEGTKTFEVLAVTQEKGPKASYLSWECAVAEGSEKGKKLWHNTTLAANALFSLKDMLEAIGEEVPDGEMDLDLPEYEGREFIGEVSHRKYKDGDGNNKIAVDLDAVYPVEEGGSSSGDGELDEDAINEMTEEDLKDLVEEHDLDVKLKKLKTLKKMRKAVIEACESEDLI